MEANRPMVFFGFVDSIHFILTELPGFDGSESAKNTHRLRDVRFEIIGDGDIFLGSDETCFIGIFNEPNALGPLSP